MQPRWVVHKITPFGICLCITKSLALHTCVLIDESQTTWLESICNSKYKSVVKLNLICMFKIIVGAEDMVNQMRYRRFEN